MDFIKYMPHFQPMLLAGLKNTAEPGVCGICVGIVGDLVRAFDKQSLPFCDDFMTGLLTALQDTNLDRDVRPEILSCFGGMFVRVGRKSTPPPPPPIFRLPAMAVTLDSPSLALHTLVAFSCAGASSCVPVVTCTLLPLSLWVLTRDCCYLPLSESLYAGRFHVDDLQEL